MIKTDYVRELAAKLREHTKLKWMTPSKITGDKYQMVPAGMVEEAAAALEELAVEKEELRRVLEEYHGKALVTYNYELRERLKAAEAERDALRAKATQVQHERD